MAYTHVRVYLSGMPESKHPYVAGDARRERVVPKIPYTIVPESANAGSFDSAPEWGASLRMTVEKLGTNGPLRDQVRWGAASAA